MDFDMCWALTSSVHSAGCVVGEAPDLCLPCATVLCGGQLASVLPRGLPPDFPWIKGASPFTVFSSF